MQQAELLEKIDKLEARIAERGKATATQQKQLNKAYQESFKQQSQSADLGKKIDNFNKSILGKVMKRVGFDKHINALAKVRENGNKKDIKEHEDDWNKLVRLTNMPVTPGVIVGDNYLFPSRDFPNPDILVKILENIKNIDGSYSLQTLERIKTLNYHISTAFNGLNQRLKAIEDQLQTKQSKTKKKKNVNKSTN